MIEHLAGGHLREAVQPGVVAALAEDVGHHVRLDDLLDDHLQVLPVVFAVVLVAHEAVDALVQGHEHVLTLGAGHFALHADHLQHGADGLVDIALHLFGVVIEVLQGEDRAPQPVGIAVEGHGGAALAEDGIAHLIDGLVQPRRVFPVFLIQLVQLPQVLQHGLEFRRGDLGSQAAGAEPAALEGPAKGLQQLRIPGSLLEQGPARAVPEEFVEFVVQQGGVFDELLDGILVDDVPGHARPAHVLGLLQLQHGALAGVVGAGAQAAVRVEFLQVFHDGLFHLLQRGVVNVLRHRVPRVQHGEQGGRGHHGHAVRLLQSDGGLDPGHLFVIAFLCFRCHPSASCYSYLVNSTILFGSNQERMGQSDQSFRQTTSLFLPQIDIRAKRYNGVKRISDTEQQGNSCQCRHPNAACIQNECAAIVD